MKQVILPTDFSENAWMAMSYAAQLFNDQPCVFKLLNTYNVPYGYMDISAPQDSEFFSKNSNEGLKETADKFRMLDHHSNSRIEMVSRFSSLIDAIVELEDNGLDSIIVMGTKGMDGLGAFFLGSMTSHVVTHSKSPVICVPITAQLTVPEKILLAIDNQGVAHKSEIQNLIDISRKKQSHISIVNVPEEEEEKILTSLSTETAVISHYLNTISHDFQTLDSAYKEDAIISFAKSNHIDLITLIRRDRGFWKNLFHHSLTKSMSFNSDMPLLILKSN